MSRCCIQNSLAGVSEERGGRPGPRLGQVQGWLGPPPLSMRMHHFRDEWEGSGHVQRYSSKSQKRVPKAPLWALRGLCPPKAHMLYFPGASLQHGRAGLLGPSPLYNGRTQNSQLNHTARAELQCPPREAAVPWFTNQKTWSSRNAKSAQGTGVQV